MTTAAQLGDSLKNTLTGEIDDRLKSLVMGSRLSPKWHWDLQARLYRPLVSGNRLKIKSLLSSRLEEAIQSGTTLHFSPSQLVHGSGGWGWQRGNQGV